MREKEQKLIVTIIKDRNYKEIPGWLLCLIDDSGFVSLTMDILHILKDNYLTGLLCCDDERLVDIQSILTRIRHIGNVTDATVYRVLDKLDDGIILLASLLLETDREWKRFLRNSDGRWMVEYRSCTNVVDTLNAFIAHYIFYKKEISKPLLKSILRVWNGKWENGSLWNISGMFVELMAIQQSKDGASEEFSELLWKSIWGYRHKYVWINSHFSIDRCWSFGFTYYPFSHGEWIYSYLSYMKDFPFHQLPRSIYPHLKEFLENPDYTMETKKELTRWMKDLVSIDANNLILLCPFRPVLTEAEYQSYSSKEFFSNKEVPLKDYRDFCIFAGERSKNHLLQKEFVIHGGNPCTLIGIEHSIVYTMDGICVILDNSEEQHIVELLSNNSIRQELMDSYVEKGYTPKRTSRLINALGKYPTEQNIDLYYWVRANLVNPLSVHKQTNTAVFRILPLSFQETQSILKERPDALENIPCGRIDFQQLIHILSGKKCYVPLYYGYLFVNGDFVESKHSIDAYLSMNQLIELVTSFPAYLGDVQTESTGIILLEFMCL